MECFGIQTFPFLRTCLKGLRSQHDTRLTSSGVWVDVHLGKMDVKMEARIFEQPNILRSRGFPFLHHELGAQREYGRAPTEIG
jgi:hypothetical protein